MWTRRCCDVYSRVAGRGEWKGSSATLRRIPELAFLLLVRPCPFMHLLLSQLPLDLLIPAKSITVPTLLNVKIGNGPFLIFAKIYPPRR